MKNIEQRIQKGLKSIIEARTQGKDTTLWEQRLFELIGRMAAQRRTVRVKMGAFGFCTCSLEKALCSGCWKVKEACKCREMEVNPEEEITQRYAQFAKWINTPLRH